MLFIIIIIIIITIIIITVFCSRNILCFIRARRTFIHKISINFSM